MGQLIFYGTISIVITIHLIKRDSTLEVQRFHHFGWKSPTLSLLAEILELRRGVLIFVAWKGRVVWKTFAAFHNSALQLFLYHKISLT